MLIAIMAISILLLVACAPKDKLYCETASDCDLLAHDDCEGAWSCENKKCNYECAVEEVEVPEEKPAEPEVEEESEPVVVEAVEETVKEVEEKEEPKAAAPDEVIIKGITYTQKDLDRMAKRDVFPLSDTDPRGKYLFIGKTKWGRTSRDKAELKEMVIKFMNAGDSEMPPLMKLMSKDAYVEGKPSTALLEFELPDIPPGFKVEKEYPVNIYFHEIEESKLLELTVQDRLASPNPILETLKKNYVPVDEFESMDIKWT